MHHPKLYWHCEPDGLEKGIIVKKKRCDSMDPIYAAHIQTSKNAPFFSIVIPVYQCEKTLAKSIESVLQQDEESYEIILVDDGSTDRSGKICDYYANAFPSKIRAIHKKINEGPLFARLDAVEAADGTYLMFLDADDTYTEGLLRLIKKVIFEFRTDMVIFNHIRVFPDGGICKYPPKYADKTIFEGPGLKQLYADAVIGADLNAVWQKCVRRSLLQNAEDYRKYGNMVMGEDKLISLEMLSNAKKAIYLSDGLYQYKITETGLSHAFSIRHYRDLSIVYRVTLQYGKRWGVADCEQHYYESKVMLGIKCLSSVADQVHKNQKEKSDFTLLIQEIMKDPEFWQAYDKCREYIGIKANVVCWLLRHHKVKSVCICFCI